MATSPIVHPAAPVAAPVAVPSVAAASPTDANLFAVATTMAGAAAIVPSAVATPALAGIGALAAAPLVGLLGARAFKRSSQISMNLTLDEIGEDIQTALSRFDTEQTGEGWKGAEPSPDSYF